MGCNRATSPTEPTDAHVVVHVLGENRLSAPIRLQQVLVGGPTHAAVDVPQGSAAEFYRWEGVGAVLNAPFLVLGPVPAGSGTYATWAEVQYDFGLPSAPLSEYSVVISLSLDPAGLLSATSSRPDILQIVRVSYPAAGSVA